MKFSLHYKNEDPLTFQTDTLKTTMYETIMLSTKGQNV